MRSLAFVTVPVAVVALAARAQSPPTDYFQQRVDYDLSVALDPAAHTLTASGAITYHNRAPHPLDSIALHLWANAYADRDSPYAQQKRRFGSARFAFAPDDELGGYRALEVAGASVARTTQPHPELMWVHLAAPLAPGDSVVLPVAFEQRLPRNVSRAGYTGSDYAVTQWYPKAALYDADGWHTMPYLDFGEYFNDFGDYRVRITVPTNTAVAATGELANAEGLALRRERIRDSRTDTLAVDTLTYGTGTQTFAYEATGVPDFAWFAGPRLRISVDSAELSGGRTVPAYAYYPAADAATWDTAASFLARAIAFADSLVGPYPYPQVSAVSGPLSVGGGMEYPMVTIIGGVSSEDFLDVVLAHEAYHNYFAMSVASDERDHAWMDEGFTTWLERRYVERYRGASNTVADLLPAFLARGADYSGDAALRNFVTRGPRAPVPDTPSDSLSALGYQFAAYNAPGQVLGMLEDYLGRETFDARMRAYYAAWAGKHPGPYDARAAFGGDAVGWAFDDVLFRGLVPDYEIRSARASPDSVYVTIANGSGVRTPYPVAFERVGGDYTEPTWEPGFSGTKTLALRRPPDVRRVAIDPHGRTPEVRRGDNYYALGGAFPAVEPFAAHFLAHAGRLDRNDVSFVPAVGYNAADGFTLGIGLHNYTLTGGATRLYILPQASFRDASLNGFAGLKHSVFGARGAGWRELEIGAEARRFGYHDDDTYDYTDRFTRLSLSARLFLGASGRGTFTQRIEATAHVVGQDYAVGIDAEAREFRTESDAYGVYELDYRLERDDPIAPARLSVGGEAGEGFGRATATLNLGLRYQANDNFLRARVFAGAFLWYDDPAQAVELLPNGVTGFLDRQYDFTFEEFLVDRSGPSRQTFVRDGSLTLPFLLTNPFSDSWLASLSLVADAPLPITGIKLRGYLDAAVYPDSRFEATGVTAPVTGGLRVALPFDIVQVSLPLVNSAFVRESLAFTAVGASYWDRVSFSVKLDALRLDEMLRRRGG